MEELKQALAPFESATVFLRGQQYATLSALPQLVHNLKETTEGSAFETASVQACQSQMMQEMQLRWNEILVFDTEHPNTALLTAALDPRFRRLKIFVSRGLF